MEINNKFNLGDEVFFLVEERDSYKIVNSVVKMVSVNLSKDSVYVYYSTESNHYIPEGKMFASREALIALL